jgi:hypothetical protein
MYSLQSELGLLAEVSNRIVPIELAIHPADTPA